MTFDRVVVAAHCQGKQLMARNEAHALARKQSKRGVYVGAYRCKVCSKWHVGKET